MPLLVVLDIDMTLIHSVPYAICRHSQPRDERHLSDDNKLVIYKRPHANALLNYLLTTEGYYVGVFSAGTRDWVDYVLQRVFQIPLRSFYFISAQENCTRTPNRAYPNCIQLHKDLNPVWNDTTSTDLGLTRRSTIMVDDRRDGVIMQPRNALFVTPFNVLDDPLYYADDVFCQILLQLQTEVEPGIFPQRDIRKWIKRKKRKVELRQIRLNNKYLTVPTPTPPPSPPPDNTVETDTESEDESEDGDSSEEEDDIEN
jgi:hypothetical protein